MSRQMHLFTVHVFRPNGERLIKLTEVCTKASVAINRAKKKIYRQGRLAHFYSFVAVESDLH
ncbi:hypothetical protein EGT07_08150 [Herbaspirillum sp. HC18]|nr:hypothetical protein EGT07_08150 [Herbaspirillum sp. HC18]